MKLKSILILFLIGCIGCGNSRSDRDYNEVLSDDVGDILDIDVDEEELLELDDRNELVDVPTSSDLTQDTNNIPYVRVIYPEEGAIVPNPVTFEFEGGGGVRYVWFEVDGWPLQREPIPVEQRYYTYNFSGVNYQRHLILYGYDESYNTIAQDEVNFTPVNQDSCSVQDQPGFNHYVIQLINNNSLYPKNGTYPYCWEYYGQNCGAHWGMIHDVTYAGEVYFPGGGDCFCSGHTLELFLRAYKLWQEQNNIPQSHPFTVGSNYLPPEDVDPYRRGIFYQYWQGFGIADTASSADAFEYFGIGESLNENEWDRAMPGDFVNLSRSNGTGHAVIFISWIRENGEIVGIRYYGCNSSGDSCVDPNSSNNSRNNSGPSFVTEYFYEYGGRVLPQYLFIGHPYMPEPP